MGVRRCLVLLVEDTSYFDKAIIRGLLVWSMWVRVNDQVMYVIGKQIVNIVSAYAPQVGLSAQEKDDF